MKVSKIKVNDGNPRYIKDEKFKKLVNSIKDFPKMMALRPIVLDQDNVILGGNMRFRALLELGYKELPDEWVKIAKDLTEDERERFIIEDNVNFGDWDFDELANSWDVEKLEEWGLDIGGLWGGDVEGNFDDEGIVPKSQYGVIVICSGEDEQQRVFAELSAAGMNVKIVVT